MILLEKTDEQKIFSQYEEIEDTKAFLKFKNKNGQQYKIIFQKINSGQNTLSFTVFLKSANKWNCLEVGYHSHLEKIKQYLYHKYFQRMKRMRGA